jgi:integrase
VFATGFVRPLDYSNSRRDGLVAARNAAWLPWVTSHTVRHICASLLFEAGRDVGQVAAWLGASTPGSGCGATCT